PAIQQTASLRYGRGRHANTYPGGAGTRVPVLGSSNPRESLGRLGRIGHLTGAKVLVTGRVFKADKETILVAKIIGTETSRVYGDMVTGSAANSINDLSSTLAKKIASLVTEKGDTLVAKVESRESRIARIKKSFKYSPLPS